MNTMNAAAAAARIDRRFPYALAPALVGLVVAWSFTVHPQLADALGALTRLTARFGFPLLALAFTASALRTLWPGPRTAWLVRERRRIGLSFALLHFVHLGALVAVTIVRGESVDAVTAIGGGLAYVFLAALTVTSFAPGRRWVGRRWQALHRAGCWYLWLIFAQSYLGRVAADPADAISVVWSLGVVAVAGLRFAAWRHRRRTSGQAPVPG